MAVKKVNLKEEFSEIERCLPWLIDALAYTTNDATPTSIVTGILNYDYQLWSTEHAACVTSLTEWQGKNVCCLFLIGGEKGKAMREVLEAQETLEEYARGKQCDGLLGIGRAMWAKVLPKAGFEVVQQDGDTGNVYYKDV